MEVIKRKSCRAILLTPENEVLLIKISNPTGKWSGWITPGGGLDEGESEIGGLTRELKEELGFTLNAPATQVWHRFHSFLWNDKMIEQHEIFYFVRANKFNPRGDTALTESEMMEFKEMRWWALQDLEKTNEEIAPRAFAKLLGDLLSHGLPKFPIEVGI